MKSSSAQKIKLTSYDDLFGSDGQASGEAITSVPISQLHSYKGHPFRVLDDEKMQETVESVKKYGILVPGIVRPHPDGGYEVVAGHRRWRACELAGLEEMPVIIRKLDDDESTVIMVDSNIQREDILPSEKAKAYRMKYEALKHQGSKGNKYTADEVGEAAGDSGRTVQRYIRLAELIQELMDYVDENKISMSVGEKLSYLKKEEQAWVAEAINSKGTVPSVAQAGQLKAFSEAGKLTADQVYEFFDRKEKATTGTIVSLKKIRDYFPPAYTNKQIEEVVYALLEKWKQDREREG
ncbi:MAG: ParB/RepB/Spo0J family partition protein [Lachnospiraceae bacterium]|nr:ParB/RepB/Spo0J family partition protein [uncultured Acetatifactor sp.]MCI8287213.1 ParB/RepB/Spo0J family partition protein [Lachnospiraceae bacterium]